MSAIGGIVIDDDQLSELLEPFLQAIEHPNAERVGVQVGDTHREAASVDDLDLEDLEGDWALVHVAGPAPEPARQPVQDEARRLACLIEDSGAASTLLAETEDPKPPAERLARRLAEALAETDEIGSALQDLSSELDHVSALGAAGDGIAVMRDAHGAVPLYAGRDEEFAAFATSKRPLWAIGMDTERVKPETLVLLQPRRSQTIHLPRRIPNPVPGDPDRRTQAHAEAFKAAVRRRVERLDRVGLMATHPAAAAALARALEATATDEVCAFVPDRANRKLNEAVDRAVAPHVDEVQHVELEAWALEDRLVDLLDGLEARNQGLVADAIPPYLLSRAAASDGVDVLLADRGPNEPHAHEALEVGEDRSTDREATVTGEGPLERARKLARQAGVTLRAPRADPDVRPFERSDREQPLADRLAELAEHLGTDPIESPPVVETENRDLQRLLATAAETLETPEIPEAYDAQSSLAQTGQEQATRGRALVAMQDPQDLDVRLQWALDHVALEARALGPEEHQRLERYLEDVHVPAPTGASELG
jgi:hypothetical protein